MYLYGALIVLVIVIGFVIYNQMQKNNQKKQKKLKEQKQPKDTLKVRVKSKEKATPTSKPTPQPKPQAEPKPKPKVEPKPEPKVEPKPSVELPKCNYPDFDHSRLIEMGLGEDDAKEFVSDLINQIDEQIPKIKDAINDENVEQIEKLTHSIKGSSTNIGVGGIADLLVEFNTYTKSKSNFAVITEYFNQLKVYLQKLKDQYA